MQLTYTHARNLDRLHDELLAAGYAPLGVEGVEDEPEGICLTFADDFADEAGVAAIVAAHDPDPPAAPPTPEEDDALIAARMAADPAFAALVRRLGLAIQD